MILCYTNKFMYLFVYALASKTIRSAILDG
jgi:hypothetical protein